MIPSPLSHGAQRAAHVQQRLEQLRKQAAGAKDAAAAGPGRQASSARDFLAKSLGKSVGPTRGSSIARMGGGWQAPGIGSGGGMAMPPKLPGRK